MCKGITLIVGIWAIFASWPDYVRAQQISPSLIERNSSRESGATKPLIEVLRDIGARSGIHIQVAPHLARDRIQGHVSGTAPLDTIRELLHGYNYVGTLNSAGHLAAVVISGRNGDGSASMRVAARPSDKIINLLSYRAPSSAIIPASYRGFKSGSVLPIDISVEQIKAVKQGGQVSISLPSGNYVLVHDNMWYHDNGDITWTGYVQSKHKQYRTILTLGERLVVGQILTPGGFYLVESNGQQTWLVDFKSAALQAGTFEGDEVDPEISFLDRPIGSEKPPSKFKGIAMPAKIINGALSDGIMPANADDERYLSHATLTTDGQSVIDLMVLYTDETDSSGFLSKLNNMVALTNQAFADSHVNAMLRLAGTRKVILSDRINNSLALSSLRYSIGSFKNVPRLRKRMRADVVMLLRPFNVAAQGSCGVASVNGMYGTQLRSDLAFGVVSYGIDNGYYCSGYSLAHELGHIMGATHDREHSTVIGKYPYSYGYGMSNRFGDIMSYYSPRLGIFSNPDVDDCRGLPCGKPVDDPLAANVASTLNQTAKIVSGFMKYRITHKAERMALK